MEIYGAAVADKLDNGRNILNRRYYRQHCTPDFGSYTKDLSAICNDLNRVILIFYFFKTSTKIFGKQVHLNAQSVIKELCCYKAVKKNSIL